MATEKEVNDSTLNSLEHLWAVVEDVNNKQFQHAALSPIVGNGQTHNPKFMFVFINPTRANTSSRKEWKGPRFPFIGTKAVWRIFHRAGMFDDELMKQIETSKEWSVEFTNRILEFLRRKSIYITNTVKWTGEDATLPSAEKVKLFLPILQKEIEIVKPEYIITFGLIPFENITGKKITLGKYYENVMKKRELKQYKKKYDCITTKIIPCYFPIGRGNPKRAVNILKLVRKL